MAIAFAAKTPEKAPQTSVKGERNQSLGGRARLAGRARRRSCGTARSTTAVTQHEHEWGTRGQDMRWQLLGTQRPQGLTRMPRIATLLAPARRGGRSIRRASRRRRRAPGAPSLRLCRSRAERARRTRPGPGTRRWRPKRRSPSAQAAWSERRVSKALRKRTEQRAAAQTRARPRLLSASGVCDKAARRASAARVQPAAAGLLAPMQRVTRRLET
jgi:hypothetical protein